MELAIVFFWLILLVGTPILLTIAAWVGYGNGVKPIWFVLGFIGSIVTHLVVGYFTLTVAFIILYAGAHSDPPGHALTWQARSIFIGVEILYLLATFSVCSALAGRARPWPLKISMP